MSSLDDLALEVSCRLQGWRDAGLDVEHERSDDRVVLRLAAAGRGDVVIEVSATEVRATADRPGVEPLVSTAPDPSPPALGRLLDGVAALLRPAPDEGRETRRQKRERKRAAKAYWAGRAADGS